jgi:flagellar basal body-associated protein FliL
MDNQEASRQAKSKKIAIILGLVAVICYVASMFTIWKT